jgi:hypothetical protein
MFKNRKLLIISVAAAVIVLAVGVIGGAVYAQSNATTPNAAGSPQNVLADKVAKILGLDASTVEAAFTQAQKEIRSEAMDSQLQKLVDAGKITQEQAAQYKTWLESKPNVNLPGVEGGMMGPRGGRMMGQGFGGAPRFAPPTTTPSTN